MMFFTVPAQRRLCVVSFPTFVERGEMFEIIGIRIRTKPTSATYFRVQNATGDIIEWEANDCLTSSEPF